MKNKSILPVVLSLLLAPVSGLAMDVIEGEILQGWVRADGSRVAGIRLTVAPGWKTYWRAPGDMGIPPSFDWSGSRNLSAVAVEWPAPTVFREKNLTTIGYKDQVVLPLIISVPDKGAPVTLDTRIDLGVCSDVCVPAELHLQGTIDTNATRADPVIAASLAQRPFSAKEGGVAKATCAISMSGGKLELAATITMPEAGGQELVVIEAGQPDVWVSEADTSRSGSTLKASVDVAHASGGPVVLNRSQIRITVLGSKHAVDILGCTPD
jgi:DsbC/DsbD-like thiol-disulfide interchange protein